LSILLELDGVCVTYGGVTALHPLSVTVQPGEFFCLLGPSGCGKTTTLNVIAGFLGVAGGRVMLGGEDVVALPPQKRRIGVVFQQYALFPHMTVSANIGYGLKVSRHDAADTARRVGDLLKLVRLEGKGDRYPRQLSGGEQQRVAIARALAIEPRLLLLDEPLSNLDARLREEMRNELKRIQKTTGLTTIFVTHDQEEAFGVGDRVAVLNRGRLEQVGTPHQIYREPLTHFVANFIGRSNKLKVRIPEGEPGTIESQGQRFACRRARGPAVAGYILYLRPEELRLSKLPSQPNSVSARIAEISFGGAFATYRVQSEVGELEICQLTESAESLSIGDQVHAGWPAEAGTLLPEQPDV
jgi:putative spermidine/putrescine transport system ATP-binding protein